MKHILTIAALLVLACGFAEAQIGADKAVASELRQLGLAYHNYCDSNGGKAPTKPEDLGPYLDNNKKLVDTMTTGKYVFLFGVRILDMKAGTSNTVLAYEKDVAAKGGQVLMGDGSVKKMTTEEFKKATLAKKP
jgi:hypothetical protein